jgi:hypothetical protein
MTPGTYLALRRKAAGFSLEDVAAGIITDPRWPELSKAAHLGLIETDVAPASFTTIAALRMVYPFDIDVLCALDVVTMFPEDNFNTPDICARCGCSEADPCLSADGNCGWADASYTLCDHCAAHLPSSPAPAPVGAAA